MNLNVDYVSDVHLAFYVKNNINAFIYKNISKKQKSDILVIAGDIDERVDRLVTFIETCTKYYSKVIFICGNHEYYIPNIKPIYMDEMGKEYCYSSINKINNIRNIFNGNNKVYFLDRNSSNNGLISIDNFLIAGDTFFGRPSGIYGWLEYYLNQNDSKFILSNSSKKDTIIKLYNEGIKWYNNLPNNLDLIVTHFSPIGTKSYYCNRVNTYKSNYWIYGHDHKENAIVIDNTRFLSNPWGYDSNDFKIKTLALKK